MAEASSSIVIFRKVVALELGALSSE
jgi:hypothetical protein